jgi:hypothetical protein
MTIIVQRNGSQVSSAIHFIAMSPWTARPKTTEHEIQGADYDIIYHRGMKSKSCTLTGYCSRTAANLNILERLKDGSTLTITHSVEGTRSGICTSLVPTPMKGGVFVTFSMTVVEQ